MNHTRSTSTSGEARTIRAILAGLALTIALGAAACTDAATGWCPAADGRTLLVWARSVDASGPGLDLIRLGVTDDGVACAEPLIRRPETVASTYGLISPDGRWLVDFHQVSPETLAQELRLIDLHAATATSTLIAHVGGDPMWSSSGRWLAYRDGAPDPAGQFHVRALRTDGAVTRLPETVDLFAFDQAMAAGLRLSWQPGHERLAILGGVGETRLIDPATGAVERWDGEGGDWSPDGRWLVRTFQALPSGVRSLELVDTSRPGSAPLPLPLVQPAWSPDGRYLSARSNGPTSDDGVILDLTSGQPVIVQTIPGGGAQRWLDATWLLTSSVTSHGAFFNLDGTEVRLPDGVAGFTVVPGRVAVDIDDNRGHRWVMRPTAPSVAIDACANRASSWSPDGRYLACWRDASRAFVYDTDATPPGPLAITPVARPGEGSSLHVAWSPDGTQVAFGVPGSLGLADPATAQAYDITPPGFDAIVGWLPPAR